MASKRRDYHINTHIHEHILTHKQAYTNIHFTNTHIYTVT